MTTDVDTLISIPSGEQDGQIADTTPEEEGVTPGAAAAPATETPAESEAESDSPVFDSAESYLESLEKQDGGPEGRAQQKPAVNPELVKAARERFQATQKELLAEINADFLADVEMGIAPQVARERADRRTASVNRYFQSAVNDGGYEAAQQASAATMTAIFDGLEAALPKGSVDKLVEAIQAAQGEGKTYSWADVAGFVKDTSVSEFKQSPEYKSALTGAFNAGRAAGERSREFAQSGKTPGGLGMGGDADLSTVTGLSKALAEGKLSDSDPNFDKLWNAAMEKAGV